MKRIIWNNIEKEIKLLHPDNSELQSELIDEIERELFPESKTRWSRILNNSSQPTIHELIVISAKLNKPADRLIESSTIKRATIKNQQI